MKTLDKDSMASLRADVTLSPEKLVALEPGLAGWRGKLFDARLSLGSLQRISAQEIFAEHLSHGDAGPALVVSLAPLRVAAYANELDAIIMLDFPPALAADLSLSVGDRLIAVCTYAPMDRETGYARDIIPGAQASGHFGDAAPLIADFLSEQSEKLDVYRRFHIPEPEWDRVREMIAQYHEYFGERARNGSPVSVCFQ